MNRAPAGAVPGIGEQPRPRLTERFYSRHCSAARKDPVLERRHTVAVRDALRLLIAAAVTVLFAAAPARAQSGGGTIEGVVLESPAGAPVGDVTVRLQSTGAAVRTAADGSFRFDRVAPGGQELYVSVVEFLLVKHNVTVAAGTTSRVTIALTEGAATLSQSITVVGSVPGTTLAGAERTLESRQLQQLRGLFTNDPFRAIQVLPGVATGDDMRSDFTVRGNAVDRMLFTFEGVAAPLLVHTVQRVTDNVSLAMINGDVLSEVRLQGGSYPQRYGDRTGAALDFRMREGSRTRTGGRVSVTGLDSAVVLEGPLGQQARGSWLASVRKSYLALVSSRIDTDIPFSFGFVDAQGKVVYDLTPSQQLQWSTTVGRSLLELDPESIDADDPRQGANASGLSVLTLRSTLSPSAVLTQRAGLSVAAYTNTSVSDVELARGTSSDWFYRAELTADRPQDRVSVEAGGELRRAEHAGRAIEVIPPSRIQPVLRFDDRAIAASAYGQAAIRRAGWTLQPGLRLDHWTQDGSTRLSPWVQVQRPVRGITLRTGSGLYRQRPTFDQLRGLRGNPDLRAERAIHFDAGAEGRFSPTLHWQVTGYQRSESEVIRLPGTEFRIEDGRLLSPSLLTQYRNGVTGRSRGVDLVLERRATRGLSGWLAYSYNVSRYWDQVSGETFLGDYDQRHTLNAYAQYRINDRLSVSGRYRRGSNFPAQGYWTETNGRYFVSSTRNQLRVPYYSRLDLRVSRTFTAARTRFTLFAEVLNVFDRNNVRAVPAVIDRRNNEVRGLFGGMFPRVPSAGLLFEF